MAFPFVFYSYLSAMRAASILEAASRVCCDQVILGSKVLFHFFYFLFIFETESHSCRACWSSVVRYWLTTTSASQVQVILLPQPPK